MRTLALAGALLLGAATVASAQEARPPDSPFPTEVPTRPANAPVVAFAVGDDLYELVPDQPVQACADGRADDLDGSAVTLRVFLRTEAGWVAVPAFRTAATGAVAAWGRGDCGLLAPEPIN